MRRRLSKETKKKIGDANRLFFPFIENGIWKKKCSVCLTPKPLTEFSIYNDHRCRTCTNAYHRKHNATEAGRKVRFKIHLKQNHKMTLQEWEKMFESQGRKCAICGSTTPNGRWCIDHDHSCCPGGKSCCKCRRDILCTSCNRGIGFLRENPDIMRLAILYIVSWQREKNGKSDNTVPGSRGR